MNNLKKLGISLAGSLVAVSAQAGEILFQVLQTLW